MPASIAHMLVSRKVRERLQPMESFQDLSDFLEKHKNYMDLGSLGPDLPYYESMVRSGFNLLMDRSDKPMGVDQWSYQLHSRNPNVFPLKLIEIAWRESNLEIIEYWEEDDQQKFAFTCGFLTHIAADQIIHPLVNKIAGPYYKGGDHREVHRKCEVYQDVVIYRKLNDNQSLMDAKPNQWCDLNPGWGKNAPIWFRYFLQKAFVEAHAIMPWEEAIEDWVDGILFTLRALKYFGPYVKADRDYADKGEGSDKYKKFYGDPGYEDHFQKAVDLALIYVKTVFALYDIDHLSDDQRRFFQEVVQNADMSAPLQKEKDIIDKAKKRFEQGVPTTVAAQSL